MVELAQNGASGMVITDLPVKIPGLNACAACVMGKSVCLPCKERHGGSEYLERVHTYIAGPMPIVSARGRGYVYVVVDDYTHTMCKAVAFNNVPLQ